MLHNVLHPSEYLSVLGCICLERGHISHQASIHFSCLLRGCSSRESAFLNVPASIRSCLCGAPAAGSALCSKRQREREKTLLSGFSGPHGAGRGYEQEPLPIVLSLSLFPFPSFNCVRFSLAPGYSQSFFRAHSSSSPIRPPAIPRRRPYPTSEFLPA